MYCADPARFGPALAAVGATATPIAALLDAAPTARVDEAFAGIGPDTVAKILFTSGSTGTPKGVINTHRMLCSNQQMAAQVWPFLEDRPPVLVDWLPWNHTFGGNFCFNMALRNGGTLYIDGGKPAPGLVETTARNLKEVSPTAYFNVPRGYDLLLPYLEQDEGLRASFFRDLEFVFYAAAALPQNLWERLEKVAHRAGAAPAMTSAWGSTETAPLATAVHWHIDRAGVIGVPVPGCELKLVPSGGKLEVRVRGPNVTPGYYRSEALTRGAFDEEGFYRIGDAVRFADPADPAKGLVFDGRVAEDFKLSSGTWVSVGALRVKLIAAVRSARAGRGDHRPRPRRAGRPPLPQPDRGARPLSRRAGRCVAGVVRGSSRGAGEDRRGARAPRRRGGRQLDAPGAGARAGRTAVDRRQRDHRQGLHQPARRARPARGAGGAFARRSTPGRGHHGRMKSAVALLRRSAGSPRRRAPEIIEAAARVFAERGYHGASTQDIADVLGIRQASLYYYFPSKEVALEVVCTLGVDEFVDREAAVAAGPGTAAEKIRAIVHAHLLPMRDRRDFVCVFLRERHHLPDASRKRVGRSSRRLERIIQGVFEAGVRSGEFRENLDCRLATLALLGMCNAAPAWLGKEPDASIERVAAEFSRLILDGAAAPRRRAR